MGCLGVHMALSDEQASRLRSCGNDGDRLDYVQEELETLFFGEEPEHKAETDKAWDVIHRALTDGRLAYDNGAYPLSHVILGGERMYAESDYLLSLKTPAEVKDVAAGLLLLSEEEFRAKYWRIDPKAYEAGLSEEDLEYAWGWLAELKEFFRQAAEDGRYVLFTASQ